MEIKFNRDLGSRISKRMDELGIKTAELAHDLGITRQALEGYFKGISKPPADKLPLLAEKLQCSTDYLLGVETYKRPENLGITAAECGLSEEAALAMRALYDKGETPEDLSSGGMYSAEAVAEYNRRAIHVINYVFESDFSRIVKVMDRPPFERVLLDNLFTLLDEFITASEDNDGRIQISTSGIPEFPRRSDMLRGMRLVLIQEKLFELAKQYTKQNEEE